MQLSSKARKAVAAGLAASTLLWGSALTLAPQIASAAHVDGCVVLSSGTVWLVTGGTRRGFTSAEVFMSHGYNFLQVVAADGDDVALPVGPIMTYADGTLVKGPSDPLVYLVVNGQKRGFTSGSVFTNLGYNFGNVKQAPANTFADLPTGANIDANTSGAGLPTSGPAPKTVDCSTTTGGGGTVNDGTEGSVDNYSLGSPEDTEVLEGQDDVEIYAVDVELADDGDLSLDRVDVWFSQTATASDDPWDYFTDVSLLVGGKVVATEDADSSSDWSEESNGEISTGSTDNEYRMRFSGLHAILESGETTAVSVAVSLVNNLDSADEDASWSIEVDDDAGFRFTDGTGFTFTDAVGDNSLEDAFTIGAADEAVVEVSLSEDSPDASVVEISKTADTNDVHIATYTLEETQGVDVNITEITVDITIVDPAGGVDPAGAGTVVKRAMLVVDGDVVGTETVPATADTEAIIFDGLDIDLDGDSELDVEVHVDIDDTNESATPDRFDEGTTVNADDLDVTEFEDANGNDENDIAVTEGPISDAHELRSEGIMVEFVSASETRSAVADASGESDTGEFKIAFDVTAFGDDMRVDKSCEAAGADATGQGTEYTLTITAANTTGWSISCIQSASSSDSEDTGDTFEIDEDTTRRITLTVNVTPDEDSFVELSVSSINWGTETDDTNTNYYNFNLDDFKTDSIFLNDM
jgi:hypothetical protein